MLICSVDTLAARKLRPECDVLLVDEAHVRKAWLTEWIKARKQLRKLTVGWSATPFAEGLGLIYDCLVIGPSMRELIDAGVLADFDIMTPGPEGVKPNLKGVKTAKNIAGEDDYVESQVAKIMSAPPLVADALATLRDKASGRKVLCFCVNVAHAKVITERYTKDGLKVGLILASTKIEERDSIAKQLEKGELHVIVSVGCLTTGFDLPAADCIQLLRPTRSESLLLQILGRGMRPLGDKRLLILDHTQSIGSMGWPDDIAAEKAAEGLDMGCAKARTGKRKPKEKYELPQECTRCGALRRPEIKVCPSCGLEFKPFTKLKEADGELQQAQRKGKSTRTMAEKASMWNALVYHARTRKDKFGRPKPYAKGWPYYAFRAWNDGVNVPGKVQGNTDPTPPTPEQAAWIKRYEANQIASIINARRKPS
jgi:superfamily II DNA or RNA helicase